MGYQTRENNYSWGSDIPFSLPEGRLTQVNDTMYFHKLWLKYSAYAGLWYVAEEWKNLDPAFANESRNVAYHSSYRKALHDLRDRLLCSPGD